MAPDPELQRLGKACVDTLIDYDATEDDADWNRCLKARRLFASRLQALGRRSVVVRTTRGGVSAVRDPRSREPQGYAVEVELYTNLL